MFFRLFFALLILVSLFSPVSAETYSASVLSVHDGDTITVSHDGHPEKIRLSQIDCPELDQAGGEAARQVTNDLCFGQQVQIVSSGKDKYGRTIGEVILPDGTNLNERLIQSGFAWQYKRYSHDAMLRLEEQQAREDHLGLWADNNPTPPWEYRRLKH